jgi:hypothetical protein
VKHTVSGHGEAITQSTITSLFASATAQLREVEASLHLAQPLGADIRESYRRVIGDSPDAQVISVAHFAQKNGGQVYGMPFDVDKAMQSIADYDAAIQFLQVLRELARRVEDSALIQRQETAILTRAALRVMEGNAMLPGQTQAVTTVTAIQRLRPKRVRKARAKTATPTATQTQQDPQKQTNQEVELNKPAAGNKTLN